jgi:hypothetical protein
MAWGRPFVKGHPKTGGRTKGTPNRKTVEKRLAEEQARKIGGGRIRPPHKNLTSNKNHNCNARRPARVGYEGFRRQVSQLLVT